MLVPARERGRAGPGRRELGLGPGRSSDDAHVDAGETVEPSGIGGHDRAAGGDARGSDDEVVCAARDPGRAGGGEQVGVRPSRRERVVLDRQGPDHVLDEGGSPGTLAGAGELDADQQLGHRDGRDRDVVVVGDRPLQTSPPSLRGDEDRRIEDQPFQLRSSVTRSERISASSWAHPSSGS